MTNTTWLQNGPVQLGEFFTNDMDQTLYRQIRAHLLANDLVYVIETDGRVQFGPGNLAVNYSYDWRKSSGCQ